MRTFDGFGDARDGAVAPQREGRRQHQPHGQRRAQEEKISHGERALRPGKSAAGGFQRIGQPVFARQLGMVGRLAAHFRAIGKEHAARRAVDRKMPRSDPFILPRDLLQMRLGQDGQHVCYGRVPCVRIGLHQQKGIPHIDDVLRVATAQQRLVFCIGKAALRKELFIGQLRAIARPMVQQKCPVDKVYVKRTIHGHGGTRQQHVLAHGREDIHPLCAGEGLVNII